MNRVFLSVSMTMVIENGWVGIVEMDTDLDLLEIDC